jgi:uncharacterized protein YkwD
MLRSVIVAILLGVSNAGALFECQDPGDGVHCGCAVKGGPYCRFAGAAGYTCASYDTYDSSTVTCAANGAAAAKSLAAAKPAAKPAGSPAAGGGPTQAEIDSMLAEHNKYRAVAGAPALTWDAELAKGAQAWAAAGHSDHSTALGAFKTYGENIHMACPHDTPVTACKWWHDEINTYTGGNTFGGTHYTQMVWKSSQKVGCGKGPASCGGDLWVCQYLPMGNVFPNFPANVPQPGSRLRLYLSEGILFRSGAGWMGGMLAGASMVSAAMVGWRMMSRRTDQPTQEMQTDEMVFE